MPREFIQPVSSFFSLVTWLMITVGADLERDVSSAVTSVLSRLPGSHLFVLDAVVKHFRE
jgi:hypothetical protein